MLSEYLLHRNGPLKLKKIIVRKDFFGLPDWPTYALFLGHQMLNGTPQKSNFILHIKPAADHAAGFFLAHYEPRR